MGSSQSVPQDSPLACVKQNLKPPLLTDLKIHKLESLCTQILPQHKLDNQNRWPELGTFTFNILSDFTNFLKQNGKWLEVSYIQAFWDLKSHPLCKDCSTYQILLCSLSPPPLQKNLNLKPLKGPLNPQPPILIQQMSLLLTTLALPPPKQEVMTPKPQKRFPTPPPSARTQSKQFSSQRVSGTWGPYTVHVPFSITDMSQTEEKLGSVSENPTRYRKEFPSLTQAFHLTWNDLYYILNATLTPMKRNGSGRQPRLMLIINSISTIGLIRWLKMQSL